jgi:diketogulonate reductase-like aldo/keto reductase
LPSPDSARGRGGLLTDGMQTDTVPTVPLPSGELVPVLGQGTWHLGESPARAADEVAALRRGLDLGMTLIDTAEMYGDGAAEVLVGRAIAGRRDAVFLVDKVMPHHASREGTVAACEASLRRLGTESLDLYLLHWPGRIPLTQTLAGFADLQRSGLIRHWGVSNFDVAQMTNLVTLPGGSAVAADQVLYNLTRRGIEYDLLPWLREHGLPVMAYSPIEQGRLLAHPAVLDVAARHDATTAQVALAWVLDHEGVIAIPRSGNPEHVEENRRALGVRLTAADLADLDEAFPPPLFPQPLEVL